MPRSDDFDFGSVMMMLGYLDDDQWNDAMKQAENLNFVGKYDILDLRNTVYQYYGITHD